MNLSTACKTLKNILDTELAIDVQDGHLVRYTTHGAYAEAATYFKNGQEFFTLNVICSDVFKPAEERTYIVKQEYCQTGNINVYTSLGTMFCI